jgi:lipopolysaccharide/colanic/teichoic acid biosynthesis glycosyltransferase
MPLNKLIDLTRRFFGRPREWGAERPLGPTVQGLFAGLHPPEQSRALLARERARADRSGDPVSVVTFTAPPRSRAHGPGLAQLTWERLVPLLKGRLRATDEVGWLDDEQLLIVLPGTGGTGAAKVVEDVLRQFPDDVPVPATTVYTYPSDGAPAISATRSAEVPTTARAGALGGGSATTARPALAHELRGLFLQPLPRWKRAIDIAGASLGLLLLAPIFLVVALAIKLTSRGPVFFRQLRSGCGGRPFWMWKFRSMVPDAEGRRKELLALNEQDGPAFKIKRDPRVTRIGRLIRATSIDELPQLWNVLRGDMSLVGPRPLPCSETDGCLHWQRRRLDVTPGLTCIWQVRGRSAVSFVEWMRMDVRYVRSRSLWQDLKLLLLTVPAVLLRRGAS